MCHNWNDFCLILVEDGFWFIFLLAQKILPEVPVGPAQDVATQGRPEGFLGAFFLRVAKFLMLQTWVWVNTYRYIFSGMNIHLPAILMFTRGTRFWHTATCKIIPNWLKSFRCDIVKYCQGLFEYLRQYYLVGGDWNMNGLWLSISWECHHPNWRTSSFFRGVGITTNQNWLWSMGKPMVWSTHILGNLPMFTPQFPRFPTFLCIWGCCTAVYGIYA